MINDYCPLIIASCSKNKTYFLFDFSSTRIILFGLCLYPSIFHFKLSLLGSFINLLKPNLNFLPGCQNAHFFLLSSCVRLVIQCSAFTTRHLISRKNLLATNFPACFLLGLFRDCGDGSNVPLKRRLIFNGLRDVISTSALRTSNPS